jgi:hypothetical protein
MKHNEARKPNSAECAVCGGDVDARMKVPSFSKDRGGMRRRLWWLCRPCGQFLVQARAEVQRIAAGRTLT